jgi:DNA-binding NtrC family response regulator
MRILLAEDEETIAVTLGDALEAAGHEVLHAPDGQRAIELLESSVRIDCVVTDIRMPRRGGMDVLARAKELDPARPVVVATGFASVDQAVEAMRMGAANYVQKPFRNEALVALLGTFARIQELERENAGLKAAASGSHSLAGVVGASPRMAQVFHRLRTVAPGEATILVEGESGTGKERVARAIHALSSRAKGPFVAIGCGALPETLLEAELFGHEKGAFTDAKKERRGRFELAHGGTLFLDDVDDLPLAMLVKLLRVLQERVVERLGGESSLSVDFRLVAATKVPLAARVKEGRFREDLHWRLHVVPIVLPPLRERAGDVPILAAHFLERHGGGRHHIPRATLEALERHAWPGNVRELENALLRAMALAGGRAELLLEDLLDGVPRAAAEPAAATAAPDVEAAAPGALAPRPVPAHSADGALLPLREVMHLHEREHLKRALAATGGRRQQAAQLLGISRKVLWEKLREHQIGGDEDSS